MQDHIAGNPAPLKRNYLAADYLNDSKNQNVVKSVHVQAEYDHNNPVGETKFLQTIANGTGIPNGIVGYANLVDSNVEQVLKVISSIPS